MILSGVFSVKQTINVTLEFDVRSRLSAFLYEAIKELLWFTQCQGIYYDADQLNRFRHSFKTDISIDL